MVKRWGVAGTVLALGTGAVLAVSGMQEAYAAAACTVSAHCLVVTPYGTLRGGDAPTMAVGADLEVDCLSLPNPTTGFVSWEMWNDTGGDSAAVATQSWVEAGMNAGVVQDAGGTLYTGFEWFWADKRPNGTYFEHYIRAATTGTSTNVSFYHVATGTWSVRLGGTQVGSSVGNGDLSGGGQAGAESTTGDARIKATLDNYQYADRSGLWHGVTPVFGDGGDAANWVTATASKGTVTGAKLVVSNGCPSSTATTGQATAQQATVRAAAAVPAQPPSPALLHRLALASSRSNGESAPSGLSYVATTRWQATALLGAQVGGDGPAYLVTLHGSFSGAGALVPAHHQRPTGTTMVLVVDRATGQITDTAITNTAPALSTLGHPATL